MKLSNRNSEKTIERKLANEVKKNNGLCIKLLSDYYTGLPDRLCLFKNGLAVFIELKSTSEKPRAIQISVHKKLTALGFRVEVLDSIEKVNEFIESIK